MPMRASCSGFKTCVRTGCVLLVMTLAVLSAWLQPVPGDALLMAAAQPPLPGDGSAPAGRH